jgi:predicted phosphoadenosine phosphosulfate sulfurtransferase
MKILLKQNVKDAAYERFERLFNDFENVVVGFSGGKDSTCVLNIALEVAEKLDRLPLSVLFIDQEAEWKGTVDYVSEVMHDKRVKPYWFQMPMVITNNASSYNRYSHCWNEQKKDKWIHPKSELAITENKYGTDRFHDLFEKIFRVEFADKRSCYVSGVRTEESPKRFVALTHAITYQDITWGKVLNKKLDHYTFYPIYDWSYTDVWKYINENDFSYNKIYDEMYKNGVKVNDMRISNLHHETAIQNLLLVQEIEPETWNRIVDRVDGASSIKHMKSDSFKCPKELPYMFETWKEYAEHLSNNIIQDNENKDKLQKVIDKEIILYTNEEAIDDFYKEIIKTILSSDWDFTKLKNWTMSGNIYSYKKYLKGKRDMNILRATKYLSNSQIQEIIDYNEKN